jgi:hypothetical protein
MPARFRTAICDWISGAVDAVLGVVAAGDVHFDVAEAAFGEVRFESGDGVVLLHVGDETHIDFGDGAMREDGLAARAGVAADEAFDVHGRLRFEALVGLLPREIADPMLHAEGFLRLRFAAARRGGGDHRLLVGVQGARRRVVVDGDCVAVGGDERVERFDEMPRGTIHHCFQ